MKPLLKTLPLLMLALSFGCKDDSPSHDNVKACEDYVAAVNCGEVDVGVDCSIYKDLTCDISDYFDCVSANLTCEDVGGTKVLTPSADYASCAAMASCN